MKLYNLYKSILILGLFLFPLWSYSTPQFPEQLIIEDDTLNMYSLPLEQYLQKNEPREKISKYFNIICHTGLLRGYTAIWEIHNDKLYLKGVHGCGNQKEELIHHIFKNSSEPIQAKWFSGELNIPIGKIIFDGQLGFNRHHKKHIVFQIEKGVVIHKKEYENGEIESSKGISRINLVTEIYKRIKWDKIPKKKRTIEIDILADSLGSINIKAIREFNKNRKVKRKDFYLQNEIKKALNAIPNLKKYTYNGVPQTSYHTIVIIINRKKTKKYNTLKN